MNKSLASYVDSLESIISQIREKNGFEDAVFHLRIAAKLIRNREKKSLKRSEQYLPQSNWILKDGNMMSPLQANVAIKKIDSLIEFESKKLEIISDDSQDEQNLFLD